MGLIYERFFVLNLRWQYTARRQKHNIITLCLQHKSSYVTSDERVHQIDIVKCTHRYDGCLRCVRDAYCG